MRKASRIVMAIIGIVFNSIVIGILLKMFSDEKEINLRSILSVASLDAKEGESIVLVADGPDERSAIIALSHYFSS